MTTFTGLVLMHNERQLFDGNVSYVTSLWDKFAITGVPELN
jgi:hypothetical protein